MKTLLYILLFHISADTFAQDPILLDREWFLNELIINGESYPRTPNVDGLAYFLEEAMYTSHATCAGGLNATISYPSTNIFEIYDGTVLVDMGCNPEAKVFMEAHHHFYGAYENPHNNPFDYIIVPNGNHFMLTVTNTKGDKAIYGTQPIFAVGSFRRNTLTVYPNPAKSKLFISATTPQENIALKIINIEGKVLNTQNVVFKKETSMDVSGLSSGIYFVEIKDGSGNTTIKKFIKE